MAFQPLPAYNVGNALNFDPLNQAAQSWGETTRRNALANYQAGQDAIQNNRQNALLGIQQQQAQRAQTSFNQEQQDRAHKALAATFQAIGQEPDPSRRAALYNQVRGRVKGFDQDVAAAGGDPNDMAGTMRLVMANAQGYQDPLARRKAEAEIANTQAQTGYYQSQSSNKDATARYKTVDNRLVRINDDGSATEVYRAQSGAADPAVGRNISGGLDRLATIPNEVGNSTFESSVGPLQGGDSYFFSPLARVWGSITNVAGDKSTTEVRNRISGDTEALAASIKPLIRKPGEGTWTDADQARLVSIVGNLATARNANEYARAIEGVRQRIMSNFGIQLPEIGGGRAAPGAGPTPGPQGSITPQRKQLAGKSYVQVDGQWYEE